MSAVLICEFLWDLLCRFEECDSDEKCHSSISGFVRDNFPECRMTANGDGIVFYDHTMGIQGAKTVKDIFPSTYAEEGGMTSLCFMLEREAGEIFHSLEGEAKGKIRDIIQIALPNLRINLRHDESEDEAMIREDLFGSLGI